MACYDGHSLVATVRIGGVGRRYQPSGKRNMRRILGMTCLEYLGDYFNGAGYGIGCSFLEY